MLALVSLPVLALCLGIAYLIIQGIYNVFFHPLRHYPGPLLNRLSPLPTVYHAWNGDIVRHITALHEEYGEVVRVYPNELSYITAQAWQDIAGHRTKSGQGNLPKDEGARRPLPNQTVSIISANEEDHRRMRRLQSHMFSEKALKEQESLIISYVDQLIAKLRERAENEQTATVDVVKWYNYFTFESNQEYSAPISRKVLIVPQQIFGDLAFGDSFKCLDSDFLHPWVSNVFLNIKDSAFYRICKVFPSPIFDVLRKLQPKGLIIGGENHFAFASAKVKERMSQGGTDRVDFMSHILKHNDEKGMTQDEIISNASVLIVAGSETTATFLSGITYNLLRAPHILEKLTDLVRTTFQSESDIDNASLQKLEYFTACLEEGFRTYPPVPSGLHRRTVGQGATISDRYVPPETVVYVSQWAAYSSSLNFADPETFVPERWLKDPPLRYANDNKKVVQPFSVGPRNCIGRNLAYSEMRLALARMLWNFNMELQPSSMNWISQKVFLLWEKPPLNVKLTLREL